MQTIADNIVPTLQNIALTAIEKQNCVVSKKETFAISISDAI